jgi:hypothetical protein
MSGSKARTGVGMQSAWARNPQVQERVEAIPLPQFLGDQFGWRSLVRQIADIYNSLPPDERVKTGIWAGSYGEADAVDLFGPASGLPRAYSRVVLGFAARGLHKPHRRAVES